jgi:hypothetical protein
MERRRGEKIVTFQQILSCQTCAYQVVIEFSHKPVCKTLKPVNQPYEKLPAC